MELRESPVSDNTAAERHADAKRDEEDLPNTKDLPNRGMEHVDEENVRRKDLHTSTEASVTGTSAECADGTLVLLEGVLHEMRNKPQNLLRATPWRLPIEGEPCECEQEVANGVVTARRTNGTAGTATLGKDLATVACGVDKGDETERNKLRLQQTNLFCEKANQCNRNAEEDIPSAQRLLLEGEWTGYASGEASDPKGNENTSNAAIEHADGSCEQCRLADVDGVMSEGCNGGTSKRVSVDEADDDPGREVEPADSPNEPEALITMSIESEYPDGGDIPRVYLRGMRMRPGNANGPGSQTDGPRGQSDMSKGQADRLRGWTDSLSMSDSAETAVISHGERVSTHLGIRGAKRPVHETDGTGTHAGTLTGQMDASSVKTKAIIPANATENVRTTRKRMKPPDLPVEVAICAPAESDGLGDRTDMSSVCTDMHSIGVGTETAEKEAENVSNRRNGSKTQNSPYTHEIVTSDPTYQWKRVSAEDIDIYLPWNAPIEALGQTLAFGEVESGEKVIAPGFEGEGAGVGVGDQNRGAGDNAGDDDEGGTMSGGGVDSIRVKAALLAAENHPSVPQNVCLDPLGVDGDAED
ncbi:hypothetical protein SCLCIDRAFT_20264 [Scleroderma citrinum Foug A]|uniref:Uncharacterized protein n=1 Tax=Scleroderma citrinum Foug A TaxID=1036808 RepID=A0A0C3E6D8_9AGAM|nr:hypothetical protein SCLCIDRAFT_20264 [Scleroderma citrinum Foug A]